MGSTWWQSKDPDLHSNINALTVVVRPVLVFVKVCVIPRLASPRLHLAILSHISNVWFNVHPGLHTVRHITTHTRSQTTELENQIRATISVATRQSKVIKCCCQAQNNTCYHLQRAELASMYRTAYSSVQHGPTQQQRDSHRQLCGDCARHSPCHTSTSYFVARLR